MTLFVPLFSPPAPIYRNQFTGFLLNEVGTINVVTVRELDPIGIQRLPLWIVPSIFCFKKTEKPTLTYSPSNYYR
jgi:hypothetical protein